MAEKATRTSNQRDESIVIGGFGDMACDVSREHLIRRGLANFSFLAIRPIASDDRRPPTENLDLR
jgi:hypothetical protein